MNYSRLASPLEQTGNDKVGFLPFLLPTSVKVTNGVQAPHHPANFLGKFNIILVILWIKQKQTNMSQLKTFASQPVAEVITFQQHTEQQGNKVYTCHLSFLAVVHLLHSSLHSHSGSRAGYPESSADYLQHCSQFRRQMKSMLRSPCRERMEDETEAWYRS